MFVDVAAGALVAGATSAVVGNVMGGGHSGGGGSSSPSSAADPFADQRSQYQTMLRTFMGLPPAADSSATIGATGNGIAMGPNGPIDQNRDRMQQIATAPNAAFQRMSDMMAPGAKFSTSDPSYGFRFDQGMQALDRSAAAKGFMGSGNAATAAIGYGQGMASTEFQNEFARMGTLANTTSQLQQQQFGQLQQIDQTAQNEYSNQYQRLAQLSGATSGSPGMAGQLLQQQQAGAAAFGQQLVQPIVQGAVNWARGAANGSSGNGGMTSNGFDLGGSDGFDAGAGAWGIE